MTTWHALEQLGSSLLVLLTALFVFLFHWSLVIFWLAWWLFATDWRKVWPVLARGAWVAGVLLIVVTALAWAEMRPRDLNIIGEFSLPNFWWQLCAVAILAAITLFCGWVQGNFGWYPTEIPIDPPAPAAHAHGHH